MNKNVLTIALIVLALSALVLVVAYYVSSNDINRPEYAITPVPTSSSTPTPTPSSTPTPSPSSAPSPTPSPTPSPSPSGYVFSDGFESGWDVWTYNTPYHASPSGDPVGSGPEGSSGTTWALESSILHSGSYAKFTLPANPVSWANVYKTISYERTLYMSGWFMFDASIPSGSYLLVGPCICGYHDHDLACGYIYNSNGVLKWAMSYYTNAGDDFNFVSSDLGPSVQANVWYNVQVMVSVANGNGGEAAMWVMQQGQSQFIEVVHVAGLTNDGDRGPHGEVGACNLQVGPFMPDTRWTPSQQAFPVTVWYDDTFASTTYIGP